MKKTRPNNRLLEKWINGLPLETSAGEPGAEPAIQESLNSPEPDQSNPLLLQTASASGRQARVRG